MTNTNSSRRSAAPVVVLTIAALAGGAWVARQTMRFLADYRTQHTLHGVIDGAHPAIQGPFTILDVQPINAAIDYAYPKSATDPKKLGGGHEDDTGIWVGVKLPFGSFLEAPSYPGSKPTFTASVTLPDGQIIPVIWKRASDGPTATALIDIPAGYPRNTRWMDLSLKLASGESAHWRITPFAVNAAPISQTTSVRPALEAQISVTGSVTPETEQGWLKDSPRCELKVSGSAHLLDVTVTGVQFENEPANYTRTNAWSGGMNSIFDNHSVRYQMHPVAPFWRYAHRAVINANIVEFEEYTERVVFRHIPLRRVAGTYVIAPGKELSLKTKSGFTVVLPEASHHRGLHQEGEQSTDSRFAKNAIYYAVRIERPENGAVSSPLTHKYHLPVTSWSTTTGEPLSRVNFSSITSTGQDDPLYYYNRFFPPLPVPASIDIPVDVTQRVNLSSHFASVAVPVVTGGKTTL